MMSQNADDPEQTLCNLCKRACIGDGVAFEGLFFRMRKYLSSILNRILNKPQQRGWHEDLLQDWFVALWRIPRTMVCRAGGIGNETEILRFLGGVIHNKAIDMIRRSRKLRLSEIVEDSLVARDDARTQQLKEDYANLDLVKERLTATDMLILQLKLRDMTYKEIAATEEVLAVRPDVTEGMISAVFRRIRTIGEDFYEST